MRGVSANGGRYEIPIGQGDWTEAEKQIQNAVLKGGEKQGKSTVVSVGTGKSTVKRKTGETAAEIYDEIGKPKYKKPKKGKR